MLKVNRLARIPAQLGGEIAARTCGKWDLEESLRLLQTDYVDVFQLHQPPEDPEVMNRALDEMDQLQREGKIRAIGASIKGADVTRKTVDLCYQYMDTGRLDAI